MKVEMKMKILITSTDKVRNGWKVLDDDYKLGDQFSKKYNYTTGKYDDPEILFKDVEKVEIGKISNSFSMGVHLAEGYFYSRVMPEIITDDEKILKAVEDIKNTNWDLTWEDVKVELTKEEFIEKYGRAKEGQFDFPFDVKYYYADYGYLSPKFSFRELDPLKHGDRNRLAHVSSYGTDLWAEKAIPFTTMTRIERASRHENFNFDRYLANGATEKELEELADSYGTREQLEMWYEDNGWDCIGCDWCGAGFEKLAVIRGETVVDPDGHKFEVPEKYKVTN